MKDLESALIVPKIILIIAGRWPEHSRTIFTRLREVTFNTIEVILNIVVMAELVLVFKNFDFDILFEIMAVLITTTGHLFKILLFKLHNQDWLDILNLLKSKHFNVYPKEFSSANEKTINFSKKFGNLFIFGCCCSSTMYIVAPIFSDMNLPIRCSFITKEYVTYVYIFQSFTIAFCALSHASIDVTTTNLIGISVGQLNILIEKIKSFGIEGSEEQIILGECVEHHIEIIKFIDKLENAVSGIIMVEYCKSALVVCFLGIQAVHVDPMSAPFARILVYGLVMLLQCAIYCFFANEILVKSVEIGDACYHTSWMNLNKKFSGSLFLIMERSKRQLYLTAGKLSIVSLQSFTTIMKSSYTYFALMQSLYTKDSQNDMM